MTERSSIQWGLTAIPFVIRRSDRRKTVALTIDEGRLVVTAPHAVPVARLDDVVRRKARWVVQRLRRASEAPPPVATRELVTGETVLYRGSQLRLKVIETKRETCDRIARGWYEIPIAPGLVGDARRREVQRRLVASMKQHAERTLPRLLGEVCARLGLATPGILVREQNKRWGSCDAKGVLRINWRIIQAPQRLVEYVLVHELVHLRHPKHGPDFWAAVGEHLPRYEELRRQLREIGPRLVW